MKIQCNACGTGYSVADEKVEGRLLKLRCKKCSEPIEVDGRYEAVEPDAEPQEQTVNEAVAEWHIAVDGDSRGPYTLEELADYYARGSLQPDTLVFRDGEDDWRPAGEIAALTRAAGAVRATPPPPPSPGAQAAARALQGSPVGMGSDPFGEPETGSPRLDAAAIFAGGGGHEGTVQFSLDQIRALSSASAPSLPPVGSQPRAGHAHGEASGIIDMAALAQAEPAPLEPESHGLISSDSPLAASPLDTLAPPPLRRRPAARGRRPGPASPRR